MLIEERQTPSAISFVVELNLKSQGENNEIKKRLEADAMSAKGP